MSSGSSSSNVRSRRSRSSILSRLPGVRVGVAATRHHDTSGFLPSDPVTRFMFMRNRAIPFATPAADPGLYQFFPPPMHPPQQSSLPQYQQGPSYFPPPQAYQQYPQHQPMPPQPQQQMPQQQPQQQQQQPQSDARYDKDDMLKIAENVRRMPNHEQLMGLRQPAPAPHPSWQQPSFNYYVQEQQMAYSAAPPPPSTQSSFPSMFAYAAQQQNPAVVYSNEELGQFAENMKRSNERQAPRTQPPRLMNMFIPPRTMDMPHMVRSRDYYRRPMPRQHHHNNYQRNNNINNNNHHNHRNQPINSNHDWPEVENRVSNVIGIVLWVDNGYGEVLCSRSFEQGNMHFYFDPKTVKELSSPEMKTDASKLLEPGREVEFTVTIPPCDANNQMMHYLIYLTNLYVCNSLSEQGSRHARIFTKTLHSKRCRDADFSEILLPVSIVLRSKLLAAMRQHKPTIEFTKQQLHEAQSIYVEKRSVILTAVKSPAWLYRDHGSIYYNNIAVQCAPYGEIHALTGFVKSINIKHNIDIQLEQSEETATYILIGIPKKERPNVQIGQRVFFYACRELPGNPKYQWRVMELRGNRPVTPSAEFPVLWEQHYADSRSGAATRGEVLPGSSSTSTATLVDTSVEASLIDFEKPLVTGSSLPLVTDDMNELRDIFATGPTETVPVDNRKIELELTDFIGDNPIDEEEDEFEFEEEKKEPWRWFGDCFPKKHTKEEIEEHTCRACPSKLNEPFRFGDEVYELRVKPRAQREKEKAEKRKQERAEAKRKEKEAARLKGVEDKSQNNLIDLTDGETPIMSDGLASLMKLQQYAIDKRCMEIDNEAMNKYWAEQNEKVRQRKMNNRLMAQEKDETDVVPQTASTVSGSQPRRPYEPYGPGIRVVGVFDDIASAISSMEDDKKRQEALDAVAEGSKPKDTDIPPVNRDGFWFRRRDPRLAPTILVTDLIRNRDLDRDSKYDINVELLSSTVVINNDTYSLPLKCRVLRVVKDDDDDEEDFTVTETVTQEVKEESESPIPEPQSQSSPAPEAEDTKENLSMSIPADNIDIVKGDKNTKTPKVESSLLKDLSGDKIFESFFKSIIPPRSS